MRRLTWLCLLLLCTVQWPARAADSPHVLGDAQAARGDAPSPADELQPFTLRLDCEAGYAGYALPVANAALARQWTASSRGRDRSDWASRGGLSFQLAYDYSVVPVHVHFEHRLATAFNGTIEVASRHGYSSAEAPDGSPPTTVRRSFTAPPSVPVDFTLAPRCAPPSRPGDVVRLQVRVYQRGIAAPVYEEEQTVTQLEPAHLYSLWLDGPPELAPLEDVLNPGNRLGLALPDAKEHPVEPATYTSSHWLLPCPRVAVTGLPLAARQFAFVVGDWDAVRQWPAADARALAAFVIGGGRLCLFNAPASAQWQGCGLAAPHNLGRGWLVPATGDIASARQTVHNWLEGELTEFVLLAGGTAGPGPEGHLRRLPPGTYSGFAFTGLHLDEVYARPDADAQSGNDEIPLARRRGFLHPLWVYRQAADSAALEPWDYPEFTHYLVEPEKSNLNIRQVCVTEHGPPPPEALASFAASARALPLPWWPAAALLALLPLLRLCLPRWRNWQGGLLAGLAAAGAAGGIGAWAGTHPSPAPLVRTVLFDADARSPVACERTASGRFNSGLGGDAIPLPPDALLRRVDWDPAGTWDWTSTAQVGGRADGPAEWHGTGGGAYALLRSDSVLTDSPAWPVKVRVLRRTVDNVELALDTAELPAGSIVALQTMLGWNVLSAGPVEQHLSLNIPHLPAEPGWERLRRLSELQAGWYLFQDQAQADVQAGQSQNVLSTIQTMTLMTQLLAGRWPADLPRAARGTADPREQLRLGWDGLLQDPLGGRGLPQETGVLYVALPPGFIQGEPGLAAETPPDGPLAQQCWLRYCFPLEPAPAAGSTPTAAGGKAP
jgi:hypothetical protein